MIYLIFPTYFRPRHIHDFSMLQPYLYNDTLNPWPELMEKWLNAHLVWVQIASLRIKIWDQGSPSLQNGLNSTIYYTMMSLFCHCVNWVERKIPVYQNKPTNKNKQKISQHRNKVNAMREAESRSSERLFLVANNLLMLLRSYLIFGCIIIIF